MKRTTILLVIFGCAFPAMAQFDQDRERDPLPNTPTAFDTEITGDTNAGVGIIQERERKKIKITYTAVTPVREWTNSSGKVVRGQLLAFPPDPAAPKDRPLVLVREGKVRLLLEGAKRFHEFPLATLSQKDQDFVKALVAQTKRTTEAGAGE